MILGGPFYNSENHKQMIIKKKRYAYAIEAAGSYALKKTKGTELEHDELS